MNRGDRDGLASVIVLAVVAAVFTVYVWGHILWGLW